MIGNTVTASDDWSTQVNKRLDRLATRGLIAEMIFSTVTARALRTVDESLRRRIMVELRNNISLGTSGRDAEETIALEMEERANQLLDQIERLANIQTPVNPAPRV
jgi:hypothetical protein